MTVHVHSATSTPAVVLNMYFTGLAIARNLGRHGVTVIGVSSAAHAPGNRSRYCQPLLGPDSREEPDRLAGFLVDLARSLRGRPVLFPTRDADVLFLDTYREMLEAEYVIPQLQGDPLDRIMNKRRLAEHAAAHGIPTPPTHHVASRADLERLRRELSFPLVAKPVYASHWADPALQAAIGARKAVKIQSSDHLEDFLRRLEPFRRDMLLQGWIPGEDSQCFVLGAYVSRSGSCLGWFTARKLVQFPPEFGLGCVVRLVGNEEVRALGMRLLESLDFFGTAEVEFKRDPGTGRYQLIEVNPRHWDQHALGTLCGVNLAYIAYRDLCVGGGTTPSTPRASDGFWISGRGLLGSLKDDLRHRRIRPCKCRGLLPWPGTCFALWDPGDFPPAFRWWTPKWGSSPGPANSLEEKR